MWIRTDTTLDQDFGTGSNSACMYTVQCRVIVDNKCEFQHASSHGDCNFDTSLVSKTRKDQQTIISESLSRWVEKKGRHVQKKRVVRSWLSKCGSTVTLQVCYLILVQPIHCVLLHVYQHSQVLRYVRIFRSPDSSSRFVVGSFK